MLLMYRICLSIKLECSKAIHSYTLAYIFHWQLLVAKWIKRKTMGIFQKIQFLGSIIPNGDHWVHSLSPPAATATQLGEVILKCLLASPRAAEKQQVNSVCISAAWRRDDLFKCLFPFPSAVVVGDPANELSSYSSTFWMHFLSPPHNSTAWKGI